MPAPASSTPLANSHGGSNPDTPKRRTRPNERWACQSPGRSANCRHRAYKGTSPPPFISLAFDVIARVGAVGLPATILPWSWSPVLAHRGKLWIARSRSPQTPVLPRESGSNACAPEPNGLVA